MVSFMVTLCESQQGSQPVTRVYKMNLLLNVWNRIKDRIASVFTEIMATGLS